MQNELIIPEDSNEDFSSFEQKPWFRRTFGELKEGSLRLGMLTLINTAAGAGMLALSSAISKMGYYAGFSMFLIAASNLYMGLYCFKYLMFKYPDSKIYSELVKEILGNRMEVCLNWIFIVNVFGALVAYILVTNKLFLQCISPFISDDKLEFWGNIIYLVLLILAGLFNLARDSNDLKQLSKLSPFILLYITILLIWQTPYYMQERDNTYISYQFNLDSWIEAYGQFIYSFNCIVNVFMVRITLQRSNKPRLKKIFTRTTIFLLCFYMTIGFSGYLSIGQDIGNYELVLQRPPLKNSQDILMKIGIGLTGLQTFVGYIIHVIPLKAQLVGFMNMRNTNSQNIILSLSITIFTISLAYFFPNCKKIFSLLGDFFGTCLVCTMPGLMMCMYLWNNQQQYTLKSLLFHSWTIVFSVAGYCCAVYEVLKIFFGKQLIY